VPSWASHKGPGQIRYEIITTAPGEGPHLAAMGIHDAGTNQLAPVDVDLTDEAGATTIALRVIALDSPSKDDVIWVDPAY
jgi:hypothetical protein